MTGTDGASDGKAADEGTVDSQEEIVPEQHSRGSPTDRDGHSPFPVVGVGASAGGLEAFRQLLSVIAALKRRILVVDDNEDQAQSLGMLMRVLGHEIQLAYDGPSAVEAARTFVPDIALIDIGIPGINGYEVARRIREMPHLKNVVLVAQTGWGHDDDRARSRDAGFDHHLIKPLDLAELQRILATGGSSRGSGNGANAVPLENSD